MIYYIDGYNVIHHSTLLRPLASENFEAARDALVEMVGRFCAGGGNQAKIVFDGRGHRTQPTVAPALPQGVEVLYSPGRQSADALIERTVYTAQNPRAIIVVSADRGIRTLCRTLNALVMDPDNFLTEVRDKDKDVRATLQHIQRPDDSRRVESRLDPGSLQRLSELRDQLKK